jgi:hypothetical protein
MDTPDTENHSKESKITIVEVNRVLEIGRLLASVLTQQEIEEIQEMFSQTSLPKLILSDEAKEES